MTQIQTNAGALGAHTVLAPVPGTSASRRHRWTLIGLATVGVAVVAIGGLAIIRVQGEQNAVPNTVQGVGADRTAFEAYLPGGSVYQQQVPAAGTYEASVYAPGGSVYQQQVPAAGTYEASVYAPGGSVYQQQVP